MRVIRRLSYGSPARRVVSADRRASKSRRRRRCVVADVLRCAVLCVLGEARRLEIVPKASFGYHEWLGLARENYAAPSRPAAAEVERRGDGREAGQGVGSC